MALPAGTRLGPFLPIVAVILLGVGSVSAAQVHTGRIDVVVEDMTGSRVPGATLALTGQLPQAAVSDARGEAHFLNLPVGTYTLAAEMRGFNRWKSTELAVEAGASISVVVSMSVAGGSESVVVRADAPVLDPKKQTTTVNVGAVELASIPTARDPWVILQSVRDPLGSSKNILLAYPNHLDARTPAVGLLDLRIGLRQRAGRATVNFDLDVFNALNSATILSRQASRTRRSTRGCRVSSSPV